MKRYKGLGDTCKSKILRCLFVVTKKLTSQNTIGGVHINKASRELFNPKIWILFERVRTWLGGVSILLVTENFYRMQWWRVMSVILLNIQNILSGFLFLVQLLWLMFGFDILDIISMIITRKGNSIIYCCVKYNLFKDL